MSLFEYKPLNSTERQIRLLELLPLEQDSAGECLTDPAKWATASPTGAQNKLVACTLEHVSLDDNPIYLALSYTWGNSVLCRPIQIQSVDGKICNTLMVTANLEEALRCFRQEKHPVRLWADAICIDQTNDTEKAEQILLMREIYGNPKSAIAWLGSAAEDSDAAIDALNRIGKEALEAGILDLGKDDYLNWPFPDLEGRRSAKQKAIDDLAEQEGIEFPYQAFKLLSERSYWTRVWIVQEVSLPSEVTFICGAKRLSFRHLSAAFLFLSIRNKRVQQKITFADWSDPVRGPRLITMLSTHINPALPVLSGTRRHYQTGSPETLMDLLARVCVVASSSESDLKATDPKDRIYGLLGLAADAKVLNIHPDYSKKTEECYINVARILIGQGHTDILSWCQQSKKRKELPSWVPDFSTRIRDPCGEPQNMVSSLPQDNTLSTVQKSLVTDLVSLQ